jgi:hypothetical protein
MLPHLTRAQANSNNPGASVITAFGHALCQLLYLLSHTLQDSESLRELAILPEQKHG